MATTIDSADIEEIEQNFFDLFNPTSLFDTASGGGIAIQFVAGIVFVAGFIIAGKGVMQLAASGQDNRQGYTGPIMTVITGLLLMYSLVLLRTGMATVYGTGFETVDTINIQSNADRLQNIVIMVVQFVGIMGF
ncbi:MAG: hypothetical protein HOM11_07540 [Methylococcales bacterium]|jgi:hypothetical protein|nr:hypothetical protein [Methylococcales bacterium]MBT7444440.1 hypothetical protein [Methylococcales bacterium]